MEKTITIQLTAKELQEVIEVLDYILMDELASGVQDQHQHEWAFTNSVLAKFKAAQGQAQ